MTADVVGLYPSIPHSEGLEILKKQYENDPIKKVSAEDISKMADFVLKNNLFEFDSKFYQQISGTAIETKFAPRMLVSLWTILKTLVLEEIY